MRKKSLRNGKKGDAEKVLLPFDRPTVGDVRAGSCTSELQLKVNCKDFLQKCFTIHFTCSESCTLSKLNCSHENSHFCCLQFTYFELQLTFDGSN